MHEETESFSSFYLFDEHKELYCSEPSQSYLQYKNFRIDLLSGEKKNITVEEFFLELEQYTVDSYFEKPKVYHLFFELGYFSVGLDHLVDDNKPLALVCEYQEYQKNNVLEFEISGDIDFENVSFSSFEDYHKKFQKIYQHLVDGDCYQVNLTTPFYFKIQTSLSPREILYMLWNDSLKVGDYSHGTYSHALDRFFLSNSPECLFQIISEKKKTKIKSLPIKGTLPVRTEEQRHEKWEELAASEKNQAELYMITDLVCNDITKLTKNPSYVVHKKHPLHVPGLIHQFSVVESELNSKEKLSEVVKSLFPGGSITGAPKKRVMEITRELEKYDRGFYCGSTLFLFKERKTASINIRSAEINFSNKEFVYGSGGGVTLQSQAKEEYDEMLNKLKSFMSVFRK